MLTSVVMSSHASGSMQFPLLEAEKCERTDLEGNPEFELGSPECPELNPIAPEAKEVLWGFGAFAVLALCMIFWLFPKVRQGMQARYDGIQSDRESAETLTASARADVAEYEARLASVRSEAQEIVEAARSTLEGERNAKLTEVNARIADKRAAAAADVEAARQAAMGGVESAVTDVVSRAVEIATGKQADGAVVSQSVRSTMGAEATT